jgi:hypothetical protein
MAGWRPLMRIVRLLLLAVLTLALWSAPRAALACPS